MSRDLEHIKAEALRHKEKAELLNKIGLDTARSEMVRDFELVARALNGDKAAKFPALRCLVRRFGRQDTRSLILASAEKSYHQWRISIRERTHAEQPDLGKRARKSKKEERMNWIGCVYYDYRNAGFSDFAQSEKRAIGCPSICQTERLKRSFTRSEKPQSSVDMLILMLPRPVFFSLRVIENRRFLLPI